jgi:hypothetical protein
MSTRIKGGALVYTFCVRKRMATAVAWEISLRERVAYIELLDELNLASQETGDLAGLWSLPVFLGKFAEKQLQRFLGMCSKMNHLPGNIANT